MPDKFNMSDVMISYSRKDKSFVQQLERAIAKTGRETWVDWDDIPPTADWWAEIRAGIEAAHTFIFIISPNSVNSEICYQEIEHAVLHNKRIIPVLYQEVEAEADQAKMHPALSSHNWIMFRTEDDSRLAFHTLIRALETDLAHTRQHTRLLVLASEWDERNRPKSLLLRGEDLREAENWLSESAGKKPEPTELQRDYINASHKAAANLLRFIAGIATFVIIALLGITIFAVFQAIEAGIQADTAATNEAIAQDNARLAEENAATALFVIGNLATADAAGTKAGNAQATSIQAQQAAETAAALADENLAVSNEELTQAAYAQGTAESAGATAQSAQETAMAGQATANAAGTQVAYDAATSQAEADAQATAAAEQKGNAENAQTEAAIALEDADAQATEAAIQKANAAQAQDDAAAAQEAANQAQQNAANANATADAAGIEAQQEQQNAANAQASADAASTNAAVKETEAANAQASADAANATAVAVQATADSVQATASAVNATSTSDSRTATKAAETAIAANMTATAVAMRSNSLSLIQEAQIALQNGDRPLALHLALLAVQREGLNNVGGTPIADEGVLDGLRFIASSTGLRQSIETAGGFSSTSINTVWSVAFSGNEQQFVIGVGCRYDADSICIGTNVAGYIEIFNVSDGAKTKQIEPPGSPGRFLGVDWSANNTYIVGNSDEHNGSLTGDRRVYLYNSSGTFLHFYELDGETAGGSGHHLGHHVQFRPNFSSNNPYLIANSDQSMYMFKVISNSLSLVNKINDGAWGTLGIAYSPSGNQAAAASADNSGAADNSSGGPNIEALFFYSINSTPTISKLPEVVVDDGGYCGSNPQDVIYTGGGTYTLFGGGKECFSMRLYDSNGNLVREWLQAGDIDVLATTCANKSSSNCNNEIVATGGSGGVIRIWNFDGDPAGYYVTDEFNIMEILYSGQPAASLTAIDITEDGSLLLAGSKYGVSLWDLKNEFNWDSMDVTNIVNTMCSEFYIRELDAAELSYYSQYGVESNHVCADSEVYVGPRGGGGLASLAGQSAAIAPTPTPTPLPAPYILFESLTGNWQLLPDTYGFSVVGSNSILHTPYAIDLSQYSQPALKFTSIRSEKQGLGVIQVSTNDLDWEALAIVEDGEIDIDLSPYIGQSIQLEFVWYSADGLAETWQIEGVRIEDVPMVIVPSPTPQMTLTPSLTPTANPTP